jgi:hypothetical protein
MVFAAPTDKRPQLLPVREIGEGYDAAIDGLPLILDWTGEGGFYNSLGSQDAAGYEAQSEEIGISQTSTSDDIAENKLNENEFWRTMRDFRGGLGQKRIDVPDVSDDSAYWESAGVDPRSPGELKLQRKTTVAAPGTFAITDKLAASDQASDGFWFISQTGSGATMAVTHYDFSTFTTKTLATASWFRDVAVGPDDKCWIAGDAGLYFVTKAGAITLWNSGTFQVRRICVAKQRIFMGAFQSGDAAWSLWEIDIVGTAGAVAPVKKLQLAPGTLPADVKEAGALILFAVNPFDFSAGSAAITGAGRIYAYDGTNAPTSVIVFPVGEQVTCMQPILGGAQVLLFVRRLEANGNVRGVIYIADVQGTQVLNVRVAFEYPDGYSAWYVNEAAALGQHVYFSGAYDASRAVGISLDAYNIVTGTVSHGITAPTVEDDPIYAVTHYQGRLVYHQAQSAAMKLIIESNTDYATSGQLDTSRIDLNVDAPKLWAKVEAGCLPLATGQKIELYWTADDPASSGATWTLLAALHPGMSSLIVPLGIQSAQLSLRAKLTGTTTTTPTLTKLGVGAVMARPPALVHHLKILAFSEMETLGGQQFVQAADDYWWRLSEQLEGMRVTGRPVWLQTPASRFDGHVHRARVGQMVRRMLNHPTKGQGGLIAVKLPNIEPDRRNLLPLPVASFGAVPTTLAVADVFEAISGATLAEETALQPWTPGATSFLKVTPGGTSRGVRGPNPHQQVPWDPILRKGQPLSVSVMVRPYNDGESFQLIVEAWDAANTLIQTDTSATFAFGTGSAGQWLPIYLEDFNYDTRTVLLFLTVKVLLTAGSNPFGVDGAQLEQAFIATPWVPPPTNV